MQEPIFEHVPFAPPRFVEHTQGAAYIVKLRNGNLKIGWSSDLDARFQKLGAEFGGSVDLLCAQYGGPAQERVLHNRFKRHRISNRSEQFFPHEEILAYCRYIGVAIFHPRWKSTDLRSQRKVLAEPQVDFF